MKGFDFITDEKGKKKAVLIELKRHGRLWEDIQDVFLAESRKKGLSSRTNPWGNASKLDALVAEYGILWSRQARKELEGLPQKTADRVYDAVGQLRTVPRPHSSLKGGSNIWRLRVGDNRILYAIDDAFRVVSIRAVQHRKDVYRGL